MKSCSALSFSALEALNYFCSYPPANEQDYSIIDEETNNKISEIDMKPVAPTLFISSPLPVRWIIAGLNKKEKKLSYLGINENNAE